MHKNHLAKKKWTGQPTTRFGRTRRPRAVAQATFIEVLERRQLLSSVVFNTLASFGSAPQGILPQSTLAVDGSGNLFGDTTSGGASGDGTVFEVANGTTTISTIASFDGTDGQKPEDGVVIDSSGDLFGTTNTGGASGDGTVFEIASGSNTITTLASFDGTNGANPDTGLIRDSSGDLFGTTAAGGASSDGTVFEIVNGSNAITTLASFDGADGSSPQGSLAVDSSGDLFGTTSTGGTANDGVVWELPTGASSLVPLASFSGANGQTPEGGLLLSGSTLYGTTSAGGAGGFGNVFQISDTGGALTAVASFDSTDGEYPQSGLIADGSGDLFGVATAGGSNDAGDVFEVVSGSNGITDVASFNFSNGSLPEAQPVLVNGNLFGTTDEGGTDAVGSVYEIVSGSGAVTTVASFDQTASNPMGNLLQDGSGDLFGTTSDGDGDNAGAVFDIPGGTGAFSLVTTFDGTDGDGPSGGVIEDSSGDLFGTTGGGGPDDDGTVFEISSGSNTPTTLATFTGDNGKDPQLSSLVMDSSGNLYGTTSGGGTHDDGTIFEIVNGSNTITTLASFDGTDGANPYDGVIMDSSGNLYGTAESGGADGLGDVFELPSGTGTISVLGSFDGTNGEGPASGLTIDSSGDLFGTTQFGGSNSNDGTVFEIVNGSNTITTLASFNGADGQQPEGYMTLDSSGDLFGTTEFGGASDDGTVFEIINGADAISSLYSFTGGNDGANPIGGLSLNNSGDVFGTASNGGVFGGGTAFELSTPSTLLAFASPISNTQAGTALATITVDVENQSGQIITTDDSQVTLTIGTGPAGGTYAQTVSADNGVATFTGITLNTAGTYTLTATDGTYAPVTSNSFDVTPGAATQFVFATQPTDITINQTFPSSIVVNAEDSFGNIDTSYDGLVTLGSKVTPTGVIFTPITLNAVNGVATFSSVPDFTTLGGYKLKATDPGITPGKSNKFFVEPPPSDFVFATSLPDLTAGATFATSVVVNADNSDGSLDTAYDGPITLGGKVVPTGVSFAPITLDAVNGVATFNTIADFTTAGGYKLKATQTGTLPAKSNKFFVSAGAASTLAFTQQPTGGTVGAPLTPAVAVQVEDSFGNPVTTDSSQVTLTVQSGPGTLGGVDSVAASGGVASFADLVLNAPGSYVLTATDGNSAVAVANSAPFDIAS